MQNHQPTADMVWVEDEIDLRVYLAVLRRWIALLVLVPVLAAGAAFGYCRLQPAVYRAVSRLLVQEQLAEVTARTTSEELRTTQSLAATYAEMLRSRSTLNAALVEIGMLPLSSQDPAPVDLRVSPIRDTQILEVAVDGSSPELAVAIANALPDVFIKQQSELASAQFRDAKQAYQAQLAELEDEIARIQLELGALGDGREPRRVQLEDQLAQYRAVYAPLFQTLQEIDLAQLRALPPVTVLNRPELPLTRVGPRTAMTTAVASVLGLMTAVFLAFLLEFISDRFRDSAEVEKLLGLPVLGAIPFFRPSRAQQSGEVSALALPRSPTAEAYRVLRSNLSFAAVDNPVPCFTISSAEPEAGKTTTVANLGLAIAQGGRSVILVEADLRRPGLAKLLRLPTGAQGLTDVVLGHAPLAKCVQEVKDWPGYEADRLRVLSSGSQLPPGPTELLESQRMLSLIEELTALADVVIFDSPPILSSADAAVLGARTGGVILVIDMKSTKRRVAQQALESLVRANPRLLRAVLTRVPSSASYYAYYYADASPRRSGWIERLATYAVVGPLVLVCVGLLVVLGPHYYGSLVAHPTAAATATAANTSVPEKPLAAARPIGTATATPSPTPEPTLPALATVATEATYVVKEGDTVSEIAALHGVAVKDLVQINSISSPDSIGVGQVLTIPRPTAEIATSGD